MRQYFKWLAPPDRRLPIEDIRRKYAFLRLTPKTLPLDVERDRYDLNFEYYRLSVSLMLFAFVFLAGAIIILAFTPQALCHGWLSNLWPPNAFLLANVNPTEVSPPFRSAACPIVSIGSWGACVLAPWLVFCLFWELRRRDHYESRGPLTVFTLTIAVIALWWMCTAPLDRDFNAWTANLAEPIYAGAVKRGLLQLIASSATGVWLFILNTALFHRPRARAGSPEGDTGMDGV
jgi:hypothetical protein